MRHVLTCGLVGLLMGLLMGCGSDDKGDDSAGGAAGMGGAAGEAGSAGSDAGASGSAGAAGYQNEFDSCTRWCSAIDEAECSKTVDYAECLTDCEDRKSAVDCDQEHEKLADCTVLSPITCDENGFAIVEDCDARQVAFLNCLLCSPLDSDNSCIACEKAKCCDERRGMMLDEQIGEFVDCLFDCEGEEACDKQCYSDYADTAAALESLDDCRVANCLSDCS